MKLRSITISTLLINSLFGVTSADIPEICIEFPSNSFGASSQMGSCGTTPTPTPSPTPTPTPTPTPSSGNSVGGGTTTISATSSAENSTNTQIEISNGLEKDITDTTTTKTVQTKDVNLGNNTTSKTIVEIPKDTTANLKASVEVKNSTQTQKTTLETENKVKVTINSDRSITSKVTDTEFESEVNVNANAESTAKIIVQKKVEVTIKTPKGSEIKQENSGKVTSTSKVNADTGESNLKPIEVKMVAEINGNLQTTANITNENENTQTFSLSLPPKVESGQMELVKNEQNGAYVAIKSNYKTSTNFNLKIDVTIS